MKKDPVMLDTQYGMQPTKIVSKPGTLNETAEPKEVLREMVLLGNFTCICN